VIGPEGTSTACSHGVLSLILHKFGDEISIKDGWILSDFLLAAGICIQWYWMGIWLQFLAKNRKPVLKWIVPIFVIFICGLIITVCEFLNYSNLQDGIIALAGLAALLCWLTLFAMFLITAIVSTNRKVRASFAQ
jgi:hypothetical protein